MIATLNFPQISIELVTPLAAAPYLLVTGGRPPAGDYMRSLGSYMEYGELWAADHGVDACYAAGLLPDRLLGDGDSASIASWGWAQAAGVPVERFPVAKDLTDTQLALTEMADAGAPAIVMTGAFGGRFDHAYSTIFSAAHSSVPCVLIDEQEAIFFVQAGESIGVTLEAHPKAISLLPITEACCGVTTKNLRWELDSATLTSSMPSAVSNELVPAASDFSIAVARGTLAVYLYWGKY